MSKIRGNSTVLSPCGLPHNYVQFRRLENKHYHYASVTKSSLFLVRLAYTILHSHMIPRRFTPLNRQLLIEVKKYYFRPKLSTSLVNKG